MTTTVETTIFSRPKTKAAASDSLSLRAQGTLTSSGDLVTYTASESGIIPTFSEADGWRQNILNVPINLISVGFTPDKKYDIFVFLDPDLVPEYLSLCAVEWTDEDNRSVELANLDGVRLQADDMTRRYIGTGRYIGTSLVIAGSDNLGTSWWGTGSYEDPTGIADPFSGMTVNSDGIFGYEVGVLKSSLGSDGRLRAINAVIEGEITIGVGSSAAGWTINSTTITADSITLDSSIPAIMMGDATAYMVGVGIFMGKDSGLYKTHIGDPAGKNMHWDGADLYITGSIVTGDVISATDIDATNIHVTQNVTVDGFKSTYGTWTGADIAGIRSGIPISIAYDGVSAHRLLPGSYPTYSRLAAGVTSSYEPVILLAEADMGSEWMIINSLGQLSVISTREPDNVGFYIDSNHMYVYKELGSDHFVSRPFWSTDQPYQTDNTTKNVNLNADLLDGHHDTYFQVALTFGDLTSLTTGVSVSGGTGAVIGSGAAISIETASASLSGLLSSTDWNTFNNKQPAGNYITALTGDVTAAGPGSVVATIGAEVVTNAMLAGGIDLTTKVTGVLPSANGGTGMNNTGTLTNANNTTITGGGTIALGGFTTTILGNIGFPAAGAIGDLLIGSSGTAFSRLADVAAGKPLLSGGVTTAPAYAGYTFSGTAAKTYTFPAIDDTLAGLGTANVFTALNTMTSLKLSTGIIYPVADSTTALKITKADASTILMDFDTTNGYVGVGVVPTDKLHVSYGNLAFDVVANPSDPTVALAGTGAGNVDNGAHYYKVAYFTATGTTEYSENYPTVTVADKTVNGKVTVTLPVSSNAMVTGRYIYRSKVAGSDPFYLLATINDNTTTTYTDNIADASLGAVASGLNTTGGNIKFGSNYILSANTQNTVFGLQAGGANTGAYSTLFGAKAGFSVTSGVANTLIGWQTGKAITTGSNNLASGYLTLAFLTTGSFNTALGRQAGYSNVSGSLNVFLGYAAGYYETGSSKFFVDDRTRTNEAISRASSMLYGVFNATVASQTLTVNGLLGINTVPTATLHVVGISDTQQLIVKSNTTQTSNSFELQTSGGTVLFNVAGGGSVDSNVSYTTTGTLGTDRLYEINATVTSDGTTGRFPVSLFSQLTSAGAVDFGSGSQLTGLLGGVTANVAINHRLAIGLLGRVVIANVASTIEDAVGIMGSLTYQGTTATVTDATAVKAITTSTAKATNLYLFRAAPATITSAVNAYGLYINSISGASSLNYAIYTNAGLVHFGDSVDFSSGKTITLLAANIITDTTTGTSLGSATNQKVSVYGVTPAIQQLATTDLGTALSNFGIRAAGGAYPITTTGAVVLNGSITFGTPAIMQGYTVAGLPAGTIGMTAYATDLLAPGFLVVAVGGGAVVGPVFYNGVAWVSY